MRKLWKNATRPALALALGLAATLADVPATATEADLGPYFERLRTAPPRATTIRPNYAYRTMAAPQPYQRPVHRAAFTTGTLDIATLERSVFNHINLYRLAQGMRPLAENGGLAGTARGHSTAMATGAAPMSHDGMRGRLMPHMGSSGYRAGGEILAYNRGTADPAQTAMRSWINSYRHKDVIEEDYASMGVGVAQRPDGAYYFTVLFVR
jgi:uncharacterized protein YkwD